MDSPPATKRQRTEGDTPPEITRVERFWLKDGNIILQLESSQYRVHKSALAMHSNFFKNLFDVPQPEGEPLIEGCQVVHLYDSAKDMEHILSLVYQGFGYVLEWQEQSFTSILPVLSAMIRLGRKYEFTQFQAAALSRLQISFPNSLDSWQSTCGETYFDVFTVINLAHEASINSILPSAYLDACYSYSLEHILRGAGDDDGKHVRLNSDSMERCIIGLQKLSRHLPKSIFPWLSDGVPLPVPCTTCANAPSCRKSFTKIMRKAWMESIALDSLSFLIQIDTDLDLDLICTSCKAKIMDEYEKGLESLWKEIPSYFGLPKWDDLKDFETL